MITKHRLAIPVTLKLLGQPRLFQNRVGGMPRLDFTIHGKTNFRQRANQISWSPLPPAFQSDNPLAAKSPSSVRYTLPSGGMPIRHIKAAGEQLKGHLTPIRITISLQQLGNQCA